MRAWISVASALLLAALVPVAAADDRPKPPGDPTEIPEYIMYDMACVAPDVSMRPCELGRQLGVQVEMQLADVVCLVNSLASGCDEDEEG